MSAKISVIGLGKLGAPLSAVLASKGHVVIGMDLNESYVNAINLRKSPVDEPDLQALIDGCHDRLRATTDYHDAILNTDITFVIVPTPSDNNGLFSNQYVLQAVTEIGKILRQKNDYHLVVITSTVMPGSTNSEIRHALENASHKKIGSELGLCYNPEFIALGSVVKNMLFPDMLLIGECDQKAGNILASIYTSVCENQPPMMRMNLTNAEITKIAVNTFVTTKISFANMLSDVCDRILDADVDVVTKAMGLDSRIGQKYLKAATAYGGPCFPRDNIAFTALAESLGAKADIAKATDEINYYQVERIISMLEPWDKTKKIAILGLAYKPETYVVEESMGVALANDLSENGFAVSVYDPKALSFADKVLDRNILQHTSLTECVAHADIIILATDWSEFRTMLTPQLLKRPTQPRVIIDCWRALPYDETSAVAEILYLGQGNKSFSNSLSEIKYA